MLHDKNQERRAIYCIIPFIGNVQKRQIHRNRKLVVVKERITDSDFLEGIEFLFEIVKMFSIR